MTNVIRLGYARKSKQRVDKFGNKVGVDEDVSIQSQKAKLMELGIAEDDVYIDFGKSGNDPSRKERAKLLSYAKEIAAAGQPVEIYTCFLSRWTRRFEDQIATFAEMRAAGISFVVLDFPYDMRTPEGEVFISIMGILNQWRRAQDVEAGRASIERARVEGKVIGRPSKITPQNIVRAVELHKLLGVAATARAMNVSVNTVKKLLKAAPDVLSETFISTGN
jgi:DNA invertase Pin-like site-specific DNA recombinase